MAELKLQAYYARMTLPIPTASSVNANLTAEIKLTKPVLLLIEKLASGAGILYEPIRIKRQAKAEVIAQETRALGELRTGIARRGLERLVKEEARKQENIESITEKAIAAISPDASPDKMDDDWVANFSDKCRLTSDQEMQEMWAKILAGEANSPGSFSKRTVSLVATLSKMEASAFQDLCAFRLQAPAEIFIYEESHPLYLTNGVSFKTLAMLASIGLIVNQPVSGFAIKQVGPLPIGFCYCGEVAAVRLKGAEAMSIGHIMLTPTGQELAKICRPRKIEGFMAYLVEKWKTLPVVESVELLQPKK